MVARVGGVELRERLARGGLARGALGGRLGGRVVGDGELAEVARGGGGVGGGRGCGRWGGVEWVSARGKVGPAPDRAK